MGGNLPYSNVVNQQIAPMVNGSGLGYPSGSRNGVSDNLHVDLTGPIIILIIGYLFCCFVLFLNFKHLKSRNRNLKIIGFLSVGGVFFQVIVAIIILIIIIASATSRSSK